MAEIFRREPAKKSPDGLNWPEHSDSVNIYIVPINVYGHAEKVIKLTNDLMKNKFILFESERKICRAILLSIMHWLDDKNVHIG